MKTKTSLLFLVLVSLQLCVLIVHAYSGEIDGIAVVTSVNDGDTFYIDRSFNGSGAIRLADINASELGQPLFNESKNFLEQLVLGKTVYLDIDDLYTFDYHGTGNRLLCVVYVSFNETHYMNVNKALLDAGLAEAKEYDNEFNHSTWILYVPKDGVPIVPEFQTHYILSLFIALTLASIIINRRRKSIQL
jgi:endonuclease YncB( thermonuclease family)